MTLRHGMELTRVATFTAAIGAAAFVFSMFDARPLTAATLQPSIFNSVEIRKEGLKPFPKWTGALEKYFNERKNAQGGCEDPEFNRCHYKNWRSLVDGLAEKGLKARLKAVNKHMNRHKYIVDPVNWGVRDYWESPAEFFHKYGDCEDYAIAKYLTLRWLGLSTDVMRIFIVMDLNLKVAHAVLAVYDAGKVYILDNQLSIVVEANKIHHYKPIFSVNETGWWKHKTERKKRKRR